jgi:glyoxylase-like metal-dependent hydrolase (beta-lactamase superfamily II)
VAVEEVVPGIFRISSTLGSRWLQQWIVRSGDSAVLCDTGIAGETVPQVIAPALAAVGIDTSALRTVVITHADVDHYGGNAELRGLAPEAEIVAHALDRPLIESVERIERERYGWYRPHGMDYAPQNWAFIRAAAGPDVGLDAAMAEGDIIELGDSTLEVLHLPGHSQGHIGLHHPATGTAVIGDAVMERGFPGTNGRTQVHPPAYGDVDAYVGSIARLRELAPARLCTGHFPVMQGEDVTTFLDRSASFVEQVDRAVRDELGNRPRDLRSLLPDCARRLGGYAEMELELARSLGAHLERLEAAGDAERLEGEPPRWRAS